MTEQEKREKFIKALECCTKKVCIYKDTEKECPYWELCGEYEDSFEDCTTALAKDALALLKAQEPIEARLNLCESCTKEYPECDATVDGIEFGCGVGNDNVIGCTAYVNRWKAQEPRVMTLEEVNALDWDYCYLEQERLPGKEYRGMLGKYIITCVTWPSITAAKISQGKDNYGRTWRRWTQRPTDEQREVTPWN